MYFDKKGSLASYLVDVNGNPLLQAGSTGNLSSAPLAVQDFLLTGGAWSPKKNWFNISTPTDAGQQIAPVGMMAAADDSSIPLQAWFGNFEKTVLASAARTGDSFTADLINYNARGIAVFVDVTALGAPGGNIADVHVQAKVGSGYTTIYSLTAVNISGIGIWRYLIYPGAASAGAWAAPPLQGVIPRNFRIMFDHADGNSITYSAIVSYML